MDKHPDKYFSNKLNSYRKEPPSRAWDRIDANLVSAKPRFIWWKLAAGVLLLVVSGFVFFLLNTKPAEISANQPKVNTLNISTGDSTIHTPEIKEQPDVKETEAQHLVDNPKFFTPKRNAQKPKSVREEKLMPPPVIQYEAVVEVEEQAHAVISSKEFSTTVADQSIPSRVITYSAQEVNKKYLRLKKKEAVVYTDPAKEKTTIEEIA